MNIIQIQDRLKGLPNEALVNYVEQPMGEVPIYLALGELQRRKEMRERFQADQIPPPSVSEQLVAENKPQQMGLGAMAPQGMMPPTEGVGAPQPQPQMDPRQLAASGIAANPQSAVGSPAMMAKGGIVGEFTNQAGRSGPVYEDGSKGFYAVGLVPALWGLGSRGIMGAGRFLGRKLGPSFKRHPTFPSMGGIASKTTPGYFRQPGAAMDTALASGLGYWALSGDPELEDKDKDKDKKDKKVKKKEKGDKKEELSALEKYVTEYKKALGEDPSRARIDERLAKLDEKIAKREGSAGNMALIEAGLNMAAGQSPDALTNIARGATAGVAGYTERLKDVDTLEKESFALDFAISQADRAERAAAVKYGMDSIQAQRAAVEKYNLMVHKLTLQNSMLPPKERAKIITQIEETDFLQNFDTNYAENNGERSIGSQKYLNDRAQALEIEIGRRSGLGTPVAAAPSSEWGFLGEEKEATE